MTQETQSEVIEPISASIDGKRNSYILGCTVTGQSMSYAACIWRQGVLATPNVKTPADWAPCDKARCSGTCTAAQMREEEILAGKAIYFRDRDERAHRGSLMTNARTWLGSTFGTKSYRPSVPPAPTPRPASPAPRPVERNMLDAMGDASTYADAITTEAATAPAPKPEPMALPTALPTALPGESLLQMARRIAAERAGAV